MIRETGRPFPAILHFLSRHKEHYAHIGDRNCKIGADGAFLMGNAWTEVAA
ncbi:hypothetical protein GCM10011576_37110 [Micromonospora parathelypteridis]|uniref:Uncharacterized protein n=1 Tax=Micromonospora parathelypteridis TaxID=1839617 RepID=A0A840VWU7_9ACTN|nr:hypothetical protein [Micromonospora parathelypteridis]GGO20144.1 hypothetical protein GCM10011576_37110 [Micromonospora parathelypteridis]